VQLERVHERDRLDGPRPDGRVVGGQRVEVGELQHLSAIAGVGRVGGLDVLRHHLDVLGIGDQDGSVIGAVVDGQRDVGLLARPERAV
jgi:hypothetical protein